MVVSIKTPKKAKTKQHLFKTISSLYAAESSRYFPRKSAESYLSFHIDVTLRKTIETYHLSIPLDFSQKNNLKHY